MKTLKQVIFVVGFLLMVSCSKPAEPVATFDLEKAKTAINAANQKFMDALNKGDSLGMGSCYHSECVVLIPNMEPVVGRVAVISFDGNAIKWGVTGIVINTSEVDGNEESVFEVGTYDLLGKDRISIEKGKGLRIWKQENGEWKIYREAWNVNAPPPPAAK